MTFKSKIGWPEQPNNLPTYQGDRPGKNQVRKAEMEAQGMKGIRRVDWKDGQGNSYTMNTRNGFPEVVCTPGEIVATVIAGDAVRGFVAHVPSALNAARFSPYTLAVPDPMYRVYEHFYTVLPFETPYNVSTSDTTDWFDVISFYRGKILINGKEMSSLRITSPPTDALPWIIPRFGLGEAKYGDYDTNGYEKRVFAIYRDSVHCWMPGTLGTTVELNNHEARPYKALMCGARIDATTNEAWLSQFAFTGGTWDSLSGGWAFTSARVAMLLTPPYLIKITDGISSEQSMCVPVLISSSYSPGTTDSYAFTPAEIGITGNAQLGAGGLAYQSVLYPATGVITGTPTGNYIGTTLGSLYEDVNSVDISVMGKTVEVRESSSYSNVRYVMQATFANQSVTVNPSPAPTHTSILCLPYDTTVWDTGGVRGNETILIGGWTSADVADYRKKQSNVQFSVDMDGITLVGGSASRFKAAGSQVKLTPIPWATDVVAGGWAYYTMIVSAYMFYGEGDPRTDSAIAIMHSTAASFVGQAFISRYDYIYEINPHYTDTTEARPASDDMLLNWATKDYILYDEANGCFISIDATFSGQQSAGAGGLATLNVNMNIVTPTGAATSLLFTTTLAYSELLPEVELVPGEVYVPAPQQRVIFTPKYKEQGDFIGAAYTTQAEVDNGAVPAYLFNFVLKLDTYYAIGDADAGTGPTINFIPCNLLEMLYAYVYSSKYGVDPYERYPVSNVSRYNSFQASLFSNQWRVFYRDGVLVDWLDALGGPYLTETMTELYRV